MDVSELYKHRNVTCGEGCDVSPFASLENVVLGDHVVIRDGVQLKNVVLGDYAKLARNVTFYSPDQSQPVRLGKYAWISYGVFGEATGGLIDIGDYGVIAHYTVLLTSSGPGEQSPILSKFYPTELGPIRMAAHCWIGASCVVLPNTEMQEGVVVGSNSQVGRTTYEAWSVYGGTPARRLKALDADEVARHRSRAAMPA